MKKKIYKSNGLRKTTLEEKKEDVWKKGEKSKWDVKVKNLLYDLL